MQSKIFIMFLLLVMSITLFFIFWPKTATTPIEPAPTNTADLSNTYRDEQAGYTIEYTDDWAIDPEYTYELRGPGLPAPTGVKFQIPNALADDTNLSADSGLSVETASTSISCSASDFTDPSVIATTTTINSTRYSVVTVTDAGAGNFYEEHIYALPDSSPCIAIRYFIHSTNIANYEPGTKKEFDRAVLIKNFDTIRDSLRVAP